MKKKDIPQDTSKLESFTTELCYAQGDNGKYDTGVSKGWSVKADALDAAWDDISKDLQLAKEDVQNGIKSPIYFFMKKELMDEAILASYVGFMKFKVKKHCKASTFKKLKRSTLQKYADVFKMSVDDLKNFKA